MEASTALRSSPVPCRAAARLRLLAAPRSHLSTAPLKVHQKTPISTPKIQVFPQFRVPASRRRNPVVRASSAEQSPSPSPSPVAPLKLESPIGQFLSQILVSHPHLLPAAVDQQLHQLQTDREADESKDEPSPSVTDLVLYRRISEVKANERKRALEEILYTLVVQKFVEADVTLVPAISQPADPSQRVDRWTSEEEKLEALHSSEAYEMIKNHHALILDQLLGDSNAVAPISKLCIGQVYMASIMYGYFLKRVDQRFQLEKSMKTLPWGSDEEESAIKHAMTDGFWPLAQASSTHPEMAAWVPPTFSSSIGQGINSSRLRSYLMSFDSDTLQRYAMIRSREAFSIIEKHTEALFDRPEIVSTPEGAIDSSKDEIIKISFAGRRRLILEAVTFGSLLWEVESYVDSRYHFVTN